MCIAGFTLSASRQPNSRTLKHFQLHTPLLLTSCVCWSNADLSVKLCYCVFIVLIRSLFLREDFRRSVFQSYQLCIKSTSRCILQSRNFHTSVPNQSLRLHGLNILVFCPYSEKDIIPTQLFTRQRKMSIPLSFLFTLSCARSN